jgi:PAS domain S-box-containing protein
MLRSVEGTTLLKKWTENTDIKTIEWCLVKSRGNRGKDIGIWINPRAFRIYRGMSRSKPLRFFDFSINGNSLEEFEVERRLRLVRILQLLTGPIIFFYAIYSFDLKAYAAAFLNTFCAVVVTVGFLLTFKRPESERSRLDYHAVSIMYFVSLMALQINVFGIDGAMDYIGWIFIYPPLAFSLLGKRDGFILTAIYFLGIVLSLVLNQSPTLMSQSMGSLKFHSLAALVCLAIIAFVNENSRASAPKRLFSEKSRLKELNDQMEKIILRVKESENELSRAKGELELRVEQRTAELISINERLQREINERRQAEEVLRKNEGYFRSLLYNMHEDILVIDHDYRITDVNNKSLTTVGLPREEVIGRPCHEVLHGHNEPCSRHGERCSLHLVFETGRPSSSRHLHRRSDGSKVWVDILLSPLKDERGSVTHIIEAVRDVTDLIRAEEGLQESEERYRTAIESSNDGVAIIREEKYLFVNKKFVDIFGYDRPEEILGKPLSLAVHPDDFKRAVEVSQRRQNGKPVPLRCEFKGVRKDATSVDIEVSATQTSHRGEAVSLVYLRDVTERKRTEQEMAALEEQFRQSQKMEAIGCLAGGVAHDFNNILTVIKGYCDLSLLDLSRNDPQRENVEEILRATQRAADLTRQLLAFSRRQMLNPKVLNVADIIGNLSRMLSRLIGEDIELRMELRPGLSPIYADPSAMDQVLMNLIVNARDAMPRGGILTLQARNIRLDGGFCNQHPFVTPGEYVQVSVIDTGKGMDKETLSRIFDPFFTTREKGSGLGLSVVYGIVKQHKGHIFVSSRPGEGSRFDLYFNVHQDAFTQEAVEALSEEIPRGTETLLVAEDEKEVRELFKPLLEGLGYKVLIACDGEEAIEVFSAYRGRIDLAILDAVMPKLNGPQVYEHIISSSPNLPCLFLSRYSEEIVQRYFSQRLKVPMLHKPVTLRDLGKKVREILDQTKKKLKKIESFKT